MILPTLFSFLLRIVLLAAGVFLALTLVLVFLVLACVWALRAAWLRLTGRPVLPFGMRGYAREAFEQFFRRASQAAQSRPASRTPRADAAVVGPRWIREVTDVEPK